MNDGFRTAERQFFDRFVQLQPVTATDFGIRELDGTLPHGGREGAEELLGLLQRFGDELRAFGDDDLDVAVARYFQSMTLFEEQELRLWSRMPVAADELGSAIFLLLVRSSRPVEERLNAIAERLEHAPRYLTNAKSALTEPVKAWCEIGLEQLRETPDLFDAVTKLAAGTEFEDRIERAAASAAQAVNDYADHIEEHALPRAVDKFAMDPDAFAELLQVRQLPAGADEILELGRRYLEETKAERARLIAESWAGSSVDDVNLRIRADRAADFSAALDEYRGSMAKARAFIRERALMTLPATETLDVIETPRYLVPVIPFAAYFQAPFFDERQLGIYVVTPPENDDDLGESNRSSIQNTSVHEAYPGHHLQFVCANRNPSLSRLLCTRESHEFIEGWAHYCEQLMYEEGFSRTPSVRFIQLNDLIWRACRVIIDVELSRGRMSSDEAVAMLVSEAAMAPEKARAEVKRYTYTPGYQLSYLYGKHLLLQLREREQSRLGSAFSLRDFHDRLLYGGSLPASLWARLFQEPQPATVS